MSRERVTVMSCDNPACNERYEHSKDEPAPGYHLGKGYWVLAGGGPIPATYACSADCISAAVDHQIDEAL
jgi:hypothetical protein